jgi:hypothetical protein
MIILVGIETRYATMILRAELTYYVQELHEKYNKWGKDGY